MSMAFSDIMAKIGMSMAYYGSFGAAASFFAKIIPNEVIGGAVVLSSLCLAYILKRTLHITFIGSGMNRQTH